MTNLKLPVQRVWQRDGPCATNLKAVTTNLTLRCHINYPFEPPLLPRTGHTTCTKRLRRCVRLDTVSARLRLDTRLQLTHNRLELPALCLRCGQLPPQLLGCVGGVVDGPHHVRRRGTCLRLRGCNLRVGLLHLLAVQVRGPV